MSSRKSPSEPLPRGWTRRVQRSILQCISLAHYAIVTARSRAIHGGGKRSQLAVVDRYAEEVGRLREELRIKGARMTRMPAQRRPHDTPTDRMSILELRAARGWTIKQTAEAFHGAPATISTWMRRLDEDGDEGLLQTTEPANKFPSMWATLCSS